MKDLVLIPAPKQISFQNKIFSLTSQQSIVCSGAPQTLLPLAEQLQSFLKQTQHLHLPIKASLLKPESANTIALRLAPPSSISPQGYHLTITDHSIDLVASDQAGAFYGLMTLKQLFRQSSGQLRTCMIDDAPDFVSRGVLLDISRDKVPTQETLFGLIDQLAEWKINHLELYIEHTFAYEAHSDIWGQASPLTGEEILKLDAYCRERFIELVPNQNSFGHLHHWLEHQRYHDLAECPDGFDWPWGTRNDGPFSLDPTNPQTLEFLDQLYSEFLPHFSSKKFNVGCDETLDLGQGKSQSICKTKGKGRVYLEFLLKVYKLVQKYGCTMHFWGDIITEYPKLVPELPKDMVVLEWGYEADHPFDEHGKLFGSSGLPFFVCPGTSSWKSIAGRTKNCLENIKNATKNGLKHGASGLLVADWGDQGHWQHLPVSYLGYMVAASYAWCYSSNEKNDFPIALSIHAFEDRAKVMGQLMFDLGNAYQKIGHTPKNSSSLFHLLYRPLSQTIPEGITCDTLQETIDYIENLKDSLKYVRMQRQDATLLLAEFTNTVEMLLHACHRGLSIRQETFDQWDQRNLLGKELAQTLGHFRSLWCQRNRVGGLQDSTRILEQHLAAYTGISPKLERTF